MDLESRGIVIYVVKTKALISCEFTIQLICAFVFAYAKSRFSQEKAHIISKTYSVIILKMIMHKYLKKEDLSETCNSKQAVLILFLPHLFVHKGRAKFAVF